MDKGYYFNLVFDTDPEAQVAIHNKNGQGLLLKSKFGIWIQGLPSQSTIKMDKGYYPYLFMKDSAIPCRNPQ